MGSVSSSLKLREACCLLNPLDAQKWPFRMSKPSTILYSALAAFRAVSYLDNIHFNRLHSTWNDMLQLMGLVWSLSKQITSNSLQKSSYLVGSRSLITEQHCLYQLGATRGGDFRTHLLFPSRYHNYILTGVVSYLRFKDVISMNWLLIFLTRDKECHSVIKNRPKVKSIVLKVSSANVF